MSACVSFPWAENLKKEKKPPGPGLFQRSGPHEPKEGTRPLPQALCPMSVRTPSTTMSTSLVET
jgi:hypothetical protein